MGLAVGPAQIWGVSLVQRWESRGQELTDEKSAEDIGLLTIAGAEESNSSKTCSKSFRK